jgi:hypothetical protein
MKENLEKVKLLARDLRTAKSFRAACETLAGYMLAPANAAPFSSLARRIPPNCPPDQRWFGPAEIDYNAYRVCRHRCD